MCLLQPVLPPPPAVCCATSTFCFSIGVGGGCHHAEVGSVLPQGRSTADSQCCWAGWEKQGGSTWMMLLLLLLLLGLVGCESDTVTRADVQIAQQWCHFPQTHAD